MTTRDKARDAALAAAGAFVTGGQFERALGAAVACPTCSIGEAPDRQQFQRYFDEILGPDLEAMGFSRHVMPNPVDGGGPFLLAERGEEDAARTVLIYGHADTVAGMDQAWEDGLSPFALTRRGERLYGRGTADNKAQHLIALKALSTVLNQRGRLGFNVKILLETGEETGSPGLRAFCEQHADLLAADVLIASDGPRFRRDRPTVFLGSRGAINFELRADFRDGAHHSGNWGGLLKDPGVRLSHAIASLTDPRGRIEVPEWRPRNSLTDRVKSMLADLGPLTDEDDANRTGPAIDADWGEPNLTPAERVFGWNSFSVLALDLGNPKRPANAIAGTARAVCQLRFVVGTDTADILPALRLHLDALGFPDIAAEPVESATVMAATRVNPDSPWVDFVAASIDRTTGGKPAILPNLGGSLPNDCFADVLGLPTLWVPHSYGGCNQHAPNEHVLVPLMEEGLRMMTGIFWDLENRSALV